MKLEVRMNTLTNDIQNQVKAGRQTVEKSLGEIKQVDVRQLPPVAFLAAGLAVAALAVGGGWVVYRSRRRRTLGQRLQDALPQGGREPPRRPREQVQRAPE